MAVSGAIRAVQAGMEFLKNGFSASFWGMAAMAIISLINGISTAWEDNSEKLERLSKEAEELSNKAKEEKVNYNTLERSAKKLDELKEKRYDSAEAAEEY
jgi:uncharacterized protein YlxW (UPF0749 family)